MITVSADGIAFFMFGTSDFGERNSGTFSLRLNLAGHGYLKHDNQRGDYGVTHIFTPGKLTISQCHAERVLKWR